MESVNAFNSELCSLYSMKPPISKTKMVDLTKLAMKAAKFYKHVVQSIEKFIHKCQPEFKIPGLYVIDSIVRQSRHQFGADKDLFSQRFSKNVAVTFHNLLTCPPQDICKIVRVLNLWQKNSVFAPTIIQPLLDMAADPLNVNVYLTAQKSIQRATGVAPSAPQGASASAASMSRTSVRPSASSALLDLDLGVADSQSDLLKNISQLLQQVQQPIIPMINPQHLQLHLMQQQLLQHLQMQQQPEPQIDSNLMAQIQALTAALMSRLGSGVGGGTGSMASEELVSTMEPSPVINKKFADVSYTESDLDDDRRDVHSCSSLSHVSALPLEHGHSWKHKVSGSHPSALGHSSSKLWSPEERETSLTYDRDNDQSHDDISDIVTPRSSHPRPLAVGSEDVFVSPPVSLQQLESTPCEDEVQDDRKASRDFGRGGWKRNSDRDGWDREKDEWKRSGLRRLTSDDCQGRRGSRDRQEGSGREDSQQEEFFRDRSSSSRLDLHAIKGHDQDSEVRASKAALKDLSTAKERYRSSTHALEPDRKPGRRRSRSKSPSRNSRRSRSGSQSKSIPVDKKKHSRSPDHKRWRPSEPEKDISRWERVREHPRLGLPPIKEQHACICSATLWIGNVSKQLKEETLHIEVAKFGKASIELIPQRGCAFVCFDTRQEAVKALQGLNDLKLLDKNLKVTWAPNVGIKESEFKSRWDVDLGVTYIPWDRLPQSLDAIAVGAVVDEESLPEHMRNLDEDVSRDDQTTSNEVTSSTDCHPDGQLPRSLPLSANTPTNNNPALALNPSGLLQPSATSAVSDQRLEGTNSSAESIKSPVALVVPNFTDKENALNMSTDDPRMQSEADAAKEATSAASSQLVQGIQNILNSTAAAASATQVIPGIITPGIMPPNTSTADSLFPSLPGVWPSLCGFNPLVPPPGFLATFDPTRPPPSLGPAAGDPQEKTSEETGAGEEDMSDNMDLDESVSSSQGDDQDFLESRIELIQSGSLPSSSQFVEAQKHSVLGWKPGTEYGKQEIKPGIEHLKSPLSGSMISGLEKRNANNSSTAESTVPAGMSSTAVGSVQGWRDDVHGIASGNIPPVISSAATGFSFPISGVVGQTGPMIVSPDFRPVPQGHSNEVVAFQPPSKNQSSGFPGGLHGSEPSQSGPSVGVMSSVISSGPGSRACGPGSIPGAPDHHLIRPDSAFAGSNTLPGGSIVAASGSNGPGNPDAQPFAPNVFVGQSNSWSQRPVSGPNRPPMAGDGPVRQLGMTEEDNRLNICHAVGSNMPSQGPHDGSNSENLGKSSEAGSAFDKDRRMRDMSSGFPETSKDFRGLQDKDLREVPNRCGSQGEPFSDLNQGPSGPKGMVISPFIQPTGRNQLSDGPSHMPFAPDRIPFRPEGQFRMPGAPDGLNRFPFGSDGSNQVPGGHENQIRSMPSMSDGDNQMHFAPSGMLCGPNRMPNGPDGPNQLPNGPHGMPGSLNHMPFGPNRMPNGSDGMQGGQFGILFGPNRMPFGPDGPNRMPTGIDGSNRMPFGLDSPNRMPFGLDGPNRMPFGLDGPNRMPFGLDGPNRMPFGPDGPNRMPFVPDGQIRVSAGPDGLPFGVVLGPNRMPDPSQMSGQTQMPGMNRFPGPNQNPGQVSGPNQMPNVPERNVNEMLGENIGPRSSHSGMSLFHGGIPQDSQGGLALGCGGPSGQPFPTVLNPGICRVAGPCPGQGTVPLMPGMGYSSPDGRPPSACEQQSGHIGGMLSDQGSMHLGQVGMGPNSGRMPGPGGVFQGSSGMPQMPPGGTGFGTGGMPSGLSGLPPVVGGRFPGSGGMPRGSGGFPCGPNGMPMFQGGRFPGPGGNTAGQDGMSAGQNGRFPGPGGPLAGQDTIGQGGRYPGPGGISGGPDGMAPGSCRMPLGTNRIPPPDGILGNPGPDALGSSLSRMPFGFPLPTSSSGGMMGAMGVRIGHGISSSDMMQQNNNMRELRPGPDLDRIPEGNCPGSDSRGSNPLQGSAFSNIRPGILGEGQQFANSSSSAFNQHSVQVPSANLQGFLENADKVKASIQRLLTPGIGGSAAFPGLFGSGITGPDGKTGSDQLCQFESKSGPVQNVFPNFDSIRLASGNLRFPASDQMFFRPQLDKRQMNDRLLRNDGKNNAPTTGRHIRRSDLFPSMKQRGRYQQGNHHRWIDRRRDHRNHNVKDFHDHEDRESHDGYRRSSSKDGKEAAAFGRSDQTAKDSNSQKLSQAFSGTVSKVVNSKTEKEAANPPRQDTNEPASNSACLDSFPNVGDEKKSSS